MRKTQLLIGILLLTTVLLAACSGGQPVNDMMDDGMNNDSAHANDMNDDMNNDDHGDNMDNDDMMEDKDDDMDNGHDNDMMEDKDDSMEEKDDDMMEDKDDEGSSMSTPDWYSFEFTDVVTGETFSISQFKGKVVLVETMATWCSNCLKQQKQVLELHNLLGERDDFVSVGISVEMEIDPVILGAYAEGNGFDWNYGIANDTVQQSILAQFGGQFLNPPATPIFIVDKDGRAHELPLGQIKSAEQLLSFVETYLN